MEDGSESESIMLEFDDGGAEVEAIRVGENLYRLCESPGPFGGDEEADEPLTHPGDLVEVEPLEDGALRFVPVVESSRLRTLSFLIHPSDITTEPFADLVTRLVEAGGGALEEKRSLFANRANANSAGRLKRYGRASFAGTAAEYVHSLWHDVTVRAGPDYLPPPQLRRRLELLAGWFPPDRGYRLFPSSHRARPGSAACN
jgi:hypothetical protein